MTKISVCMIVKNEEKTLERCLSSLADSVDEIIVVDTGSTDKTKEIAKKFEAKIFDFKWVSDFSKARQYAKDQATGDWILQIDADEYFPEGEASRLKEEVEKTNQMGIMVKINNLVGENEETIIHKSVRLFKNIPEIIYKLRIHEQITYNGDILDENKNSNLMLMHTGYLEETVKEKNKRQRNLKILKEEINENPNDGFVNFNIANEYVALKDYNKALSHYQTAYKYGKGKTYESRTVSRIISILIELKRYKEAHAVINDAKKIYQNYTDILFSEGQLLEKEGRISDAMMIYEECIRLGESDESHVTNKGVGTNYPLERLAELSIEKRDFKNAMEYSMVLLSVDRYNFRNIERIVSILSNTTTEDELVDYLERIYPNTTAKNLQIKLSVFHKFRIKKGILKYYENIIKGASVGDKEMEFYLGYYKKDQEKMKKALEAMIDSKHESALKTGILYILENEDLEMKNKIGAISKTSSLILQILNGEEAQKGKNYNSKELMSVLDEIILVKEYTVFDKLLPLIDYFSSDVIREIGELFYKIYRDDIAIQFFAMYLSKNKNDMKITMKTAEMLYVSEMYEDAIELAKKALSMKKNYFKPVEIIIESNKALGEREIIKSICQDALKVFPESIYIEQNLRSVL